MTCKWRETEIVWQNLLFCVNKYLTKIKLVVLKCNWTSGQTLVISPAGLTAATMAEALALQKMRMMMRFHSNSKHGNRVKTSPSENDGTGTSWHLLCLLNLSSIMTTHLSLEPLLFIRYWRIMGERAGPPLPSPLHSCSPTTWFSISSPQHFAATQRTIGQSWVTQLLSLDSPVAFQCNGNSMAAQQHLIVLLLVPASSQGYQTFLLWWCHTPFFLLVSPLLALPWPWTTWVSWVAWQTWLPCHSFIMKKARWQR